MEKIIIKLLLIIVFSLLILVGYKVMKPVTTVTVPVTSSVQPNSSDGTNEKEHIQSVVKEYLMNNPEVITNALEALQKRKKLEMDEKVYSFIKEHREDIESSAMAPFVGNKDGDIIITSFYDYNCSYCKKGNHYLNQLAESDSNVKIILRPLPILGDSSNYASRIILAVHKIAPDKFAPIHEGFMQLKTITKESIEALLIQHSLNVAKIEEDATMTEIADNINKNFELAGNLKIHGTPAYIINGRLVAGLIDLNQLQQIVSDIRANNK